jgi:hypothetical protein
MNLTISLTEKLNRSNERSNLYDANSYTDDVYLRKRSAKNEAFFIAGSFIMIPQLLKTATLRKLTKLTVLYGLSIDDAWDNGIERKKLNGSFINSEKLNEHLHPYFAQRLKKRKEDLDNIISEEKIKTNIQNFTDTIMLVEGLSLAIPYTKENWTFQLKETFRALNAIVWAGLYESYKLNSDLILPKIEREKYVENPKRGLTNLYNEYSSILFDSGKSGKMALSYGWQMVSVQAAMDIWNNDFEDKDCIFSLYEENLSDKDKKELLKSYMNKSDEYNNKKSLAKILMPFFPIIYHSIIDRK